MRRKLLSVVSLLAFTAAVAPVSAQTPRVPGTNLQIFVMTMGPGAEVWERFGHNAIWVRDTVEKRDLVYNYGMFDFRDPNLVPRFAMGRPVYWLGVDDLDRTIAQYTHGQRAIDVQELDLPPIKRAEIALRLAENEKKEQRYYVYDYYRDNCSTRVRDLLDAALGGSLRQLAEGKPAEGTLRWHTHRSLTNDKPMYVGILLALGPMVDRPLDQWGEMFLPKKLQERLRELHVTDENGRVVPLVKSEQRLLDISTYAVDDAPPDWGMMFSLVALALMLGMLSGLIDGPIGAPGRVLGGVWMVVMGVGGVVLLLLWLVTNHVAAAGNRNILLLSPLALFVVPGVFSAKRRGPGAWAPRAAWIVLGSAIIGSMLAAFPSIGHQWNLQVAQLTVLPTVAAAWLAIRLTPRRASAPAPPR